MIADDQVERLTEWVHEGIEYLGKGNRQVVEQTAKRLDKRARQRDKLLDLYYDDDIDREKFREEQQRLDREERQARIRLA